MCGLQLSWRRDMSITTSHPIDRLSALPVPSPRRTLPPVPSGCWYVLRRWSALAGVPTEVGSRAAICDRLGRGADGEAFELLEVVVRERSWVGVADCEFVGMSKAVLTREGSRVGSAYAGELAVRDEWLVGLKIDISDRFVGPRGWVTGDLDGPLSPNWLGDSAELNGAEPS